MQPDVILLPLALLSLIIASYTDLKTREVPDWLNYALLFSAFGIRILFAIELDWSVLISGILGFSVCFILAYLFYQTDQWGGGDSKLLMGMGAIIGISYPLNSSSLNLLWYILALLFLGSLYGVLWMLYLALSKKSLFWPIWKEKIKKQHKLNLIFILISIGFVILTFFFKSAWPLIILPLFLFYLFLFVSTMEDHFFIKNVTPSELTEGDWLAQDITVDGRTLIYKKTLEQNDLKKLTTLHKDKKISTIAIKEGVPFVPSFLFAYLFLQFGLPYISPLLNKIF